MKFVILHIIRAIFGHVDDFILLLLCRKTHFALNFNVKKIHEKKYSELFLFYMCSLEIDERLKKKLNMF